MFTQKFTAKNSPSEQFLKKILNRLTKLNGKKLADRAKFHLNNVVNSSNNKESQPAMNK